LHKARPVALGLKSGREDFLFLLAPARRGFFSEKLIDLFPPIPQPPAIPHKCAILHSFPRS